MQDPNQPQPQPIPQQPNPTPTPQSPEQPQQAQQPQQPTTPVQPDPFTPQQTASPFFANQPAESQQTPSQPEFSTNAPVPTPEKKSKKTLFIIIAVLAALLIGGGITAYALTNANNAPSGLAAGQAGEDTSEEVAPDQKEAIVAANIADFKAVCENKIISNAAETAKPYKLMPFLKTADDWGLYALADNRLSSDIAAVNAVACISVDSSTEKLVQSGCEATNIATRSKVTVDAYSATYTIDYYAPKTGEKISSTTVTPASQSCPLYANAAGKHYIMLLDSDMKPVLDAFFG